jgi:hypothetical protein
VGPNALAYIALIICPVVSFAIVAMFRAPIAVPLIILGGQMFLPPVLTFDAPLVPPLGKDIIPPLSALLACAVLRPRSLTRAKPGRSYDWFLTLQCLAYYGTYITNREAIWFGPRMFPGHTFHDVLSGAVSTYIYWWPPFFLGRALYKTSKDLRSLFVMVAGAGIVYTPFLAIEMKMSPQLNLWVYGFHQSDFIQTIRGGGYRPKVFMRHGLNVGFFMCFTLLAAGALVKIKKRVLGFKPRLAMIYLLVFLILCRSAGALTYAVAFLPLILFAKVKTQTRWTRIVVLLVFSYPLCRAMGLVPVEKINDFFLSMFGQDRAGSLGYRLEQEGKVMERALTRWVFGWGAYGRMWPHDPVTGGDLFAVDGLWAIQMGVRGVAGYVTLFGMLLLPAWRARNMMARIASPQDRILVAALGIMTVVYVADMIPNSSIDPYLTFLVGVLTGLERGLEPLPDKAAAVVQAQAPPAYPAAGHVPAA